MSASEAKPIKKRRGKKRPSTRNRGNGVGSSVGELLKRLRAEGGTESIARQQEQQISFSSTVVIGAEVVAASSDGQSSSISTAHETVELELTHTNVTICEQTEHVQHKEQHQTELQQYQQEQQQIRLQQQQQQAMAAENYARACRTALIEARPYLQAWDTSAPVSPLVHADTRRINNNNFFKGVKFSPDGLCLLTASQDCSMRVLEVPTSLFTPLLRKSQTTITATTTTVNSSEGDKTSIEHEQEPQFALQDKQEINDQQNDGGNEAAVLEDMRTALWYAEGETVYDYCWFPRMHSSYPASCCFLSTSLDHPIHLWDAYSGTLRASYIAKDTQDDPTSAMCVAFNPSGSHIYAGFERCIKVFDTSRPGTSSVENRPTCKTRRSDVGQRGLISCLAFNPDMSGLFAAGSYARSVVLYVENDPKAVMAELPHGEHAGGVTQVQFSRDGRWLYSGARMDDNVLCWDVRYTRNVLHRFHRPARTNQRIGFDLDASGRHLVTGTSECHALVYDTFTGELVRKLEDGNVTTDAVNGASFCPTDPGVIALATGQRTFEEPDNDSDDDSDNNDADAALRREARGGMISKKSTNCVSVWRGKMKFDQGGGVAGGEE